MKKYTMGLFLLLSLSFSFGRSTVSSIPGDKKYELVENKTIVIYKKSYIGNKQTGFKSILEYYFSKGLTGKIEKLTLQNLKDAFRDNDMVLDKIDQYFRSDADLVMYDSYHKTYKVNHVLSITM